ncbi:MAG: type IV toxin-antitoxin system AbiEi family antitoxin domain-containing protein [Propionibacteriaceae bacterium]
MAVTRGFFTRSEALDSGESDKTLISGLRSDVLVRIRHGYYTFADLWSVLGAEERHVTRAGAVQHSLGPSVALSHVSGALARGVVTWGIDLTRVHVTRLDQGAGRTEPDIVHHQGRRGSDDLEIINGLQVFPADRCVVEAATLATSESALVLFDSFLHLRLGDDRQLRRRFEQMHRWPRTQHLHVPVRMADGNADGAGESRGRWLFWRSGIPAPELQYEVHRPNGTLVGVCDWAWRDLGLLGEFDGRVKYGRLLKPGESAGDAVFREKRREDELRETTGHGMVRLVWADYSTPQATAERVRRLLRRAG